MAADEERIKQLIPAEFHMISGSHDSQTSADAYNVSQFQLPNPAGKAGGTSYEFALSFSSPKFNSLVMAI